MQTFSINTLGCKVNQYESQQIRELLERLGLHKVESTTTSDLVVINTCCVTHTASTKSRQHIRRAQKQSPDAVVVVSGCLPTTETGELSLGLSRKGRLTVLTQCTPANNVHLIRNRSDLAATLCRIADPLGTATVSKTTQSRSNTPIKAKNNAEIKHKNRSENHLELPSLTSFDGQSRAFLKIQDGCDGYCSYCVIPMTRPFVRSKPPGAVLKEAAALVESGHGEIVVTGVFLGAYGQETVKRKKWLHKQNDNMADLLDEMAEIPGLARIRLSSLEPADATPRLLDTFCRHRNIMPHLHLPLQSGSQAILKRMCRQYRADEFRKTVASIKSRLDRPAITTDIIVGFPGETQADFDQTVSLAKEVGFAKMHIFSFSPRRGTAAARMQDAIDGKVIRERSKIMQELDTQLGLEYRRQFLGGIAEILLEKDGGRACGRSERYFTVHLENADRRLKRNSVVRVKLLKNNENGMVGSPLL